MTPFIIMIAVPAFASLILNRKTENIKQQTKHKVSVIIFFTILLAILMLRHEDIGIDLKNYLSTFSAMDNYSFSQAFERFDYFEPGFTALTKIIAEITNREQLFVAIIALISVIPLASLYSKNSENALLTIAMFIIMPNFTMLFSGLRQVIAMAFVAISYKFAKEKKLLWFLVIVTIAMLFHKSAFIAFLLYPIYHMNINRVKILVATPVIGLIFIFNKPIFEFLLQFINDYYDYSYSETGAYTMIVLFALYVVFSYISPDDQNMDKETIGLRNLAVMTVILQIFALASPVAMRMNLYYTMFLPLLIPKIINRASQRNKRIFKIVGIVMTIFFIAYYLYGVSSGESALKIYPYKFFWQ